MITFKQYLKDCDYNYNKMNNSTGVLAKSILEDKDFPATDDYTMILNYLNKQDASNDVIEAFNNVYVNFDRYE